MMAYSPKAGHLTEHEDLGVDSTGRHMIKCCETGDIHEKPSQAAIARRDAKKAERYKDRTFNELSEAVRKEREEGI